MYIEANAMYITWRLWYRHARFRTIPFMSHCRRCVFPVEREVLAYEYSQPDCAGKPEGLVMAVPQADGETTSLESGTQIHHAEHPHPVGRNGVFFLHDADL